jgi:hypothetical protein
VSLLELCIRFARSGSICVTALLFCNPFKAVAPRTPVADYEASTDALCEFFLHRVHKDPWLALDSVNVETFKSSRSEQRVKASIHFTLLAIKISGSRTAPALSPEKLCFYSPYAAHRPRLAKVVPIEWTATIS